MRRYSRIALQQDRIDQVLMGEDRFVLIEGLYPRMWESLAWLDGSESIGQSHFECVGRHFTCQPDAGTPA